MRRGIFCLAVLFLIGCKKNIEKENLQELNGYWEITEVEFPNGQKKTYTISTTIDFIAFENMSGYRKKVQPRLDGTYQTSDDAERFEISERDDAFYLTYSNGTEQWEEKLISLAENSFSVQNQDKKIYRYTKYKPLNLFPDAKTPK